MNPVSILGGGNIGGAIAEGLVASGQFRAEEITVTRRKKKFLEIFQEKGFTAHSNNAKAVEESEIIIVAVATQQLADLMSEITSSLDSRRHILVSVMSGTPINHFESLVGSEIPIVRAMPNTAIAIQESMTCLSSNHEGEALAKVQRIFDALGKTLIIEEKLIESATALCACGIAFFLRAIRAASQGGIEIGFHAEEAILMASQTAKGAASLLLKNKSHPEQEIDKVTTPRGITITGLNEMEHRGFSSAFIKGINTSAEKALL